MNIKSLLIMTPAGPMCNAVLQPGLALNWFLSRMMTYEDQITWTDGAEN